jgi:glycosyltransferase involved in cell wall biosynthesis
MNTVKHNPVIHLSSSSIKVLHIAPTPFFADRGCHIRIRNEIESLFARPVTILLCTYHLGKDIQGIDIRRIPRIPGYKKLDAGYSPFKFPADILLFFLILKTCWLEKPEILHGHLHEGALIGWAVKVLFFWRRMFLIMDMQGSLSGELTSYGTLKTESLLTRITVLIESMICRMPDFFFCSSGESRKTLLTRFNIDAEKTSLLQDVVPDVFFKDQDKKSLYREFGIPGQKKVVLYTGSLLPGKGVQYILDAMTLLCSKRDDLFFVLVGYPRNEIAELTEKNGLGENVLLPGQVAYADLPKWLAVGDIALEPKGHDSGEASGKLLHSMATGLPIVCFDTSNNRKFLHDLGFYAPDISAESFAQAIIVAIDDPGAAYRGVLGKEIIRSTYTMEVVGENLVNIYNQIVCNSSTKL